MITPERLAEIRQLASETHSPVFARALNNLLAHLDAVRGKREKKTWRCFHCDETFSTPGAARDHFGYDPSSDPACRIKIGAERGLVMSLRKVEAELAQYTHLLHDESLEAYRLLAAARSHHSEQLRTVEELGYERGLADGRAYGNETLMRERDEEREVTKNCPRCRNALALAESERQVLAHLQSTTDPARVRPK